jgi:general nucleoside transport system permease protein
VEAIVNVGASMLRLSAPLLLAAMAGVLSYQVGLINIALEGLMLVGAFAAVVIGNAAGSTWMGVVAACVAGALIAGLFAVFVVRLRANLIVAGLAVNFLALGGTAYLLQVLFKARGTFAPSTLDKLPLLDIPVIGGIPVLGSLISGYSPLVYLSWIIVPLIAIFLYRTAMGTHIRAVGEHAEAARTAGISVNRMQYTALILGGILCGLAGAHLAVGDLALFRENMTNGRGFIALAGVYFAAARPIPAAIACLVFGLFDALQVRLQTSGSIPSQFFQMLPYLMVVGVLVAVSARKEWRKGW